MGWKRNKATGEVIYVEDGVQGIPIGPQDPRVPYQAPQAEADLAAKRTSTAKTAQDMQLDPRRLAIQERDAALKEQDLLQRRQQSERDRAAARAPLDALNQQLRRTWDLYAQGPGSTPAWSPSALMDFNPLSDVNSRFNAAAAGIGEIGRNAFRTPGQGSQSDKELSAFIEANQPTASDTDAKIQEKLGNLERRLGAQYRAYGIPYQPYRPKPAPTKRGAPPTAPKKSGGVDPEVERYLKQYGGR